MSTANSAHTPELPVDRATYEHYRIGNAELGLVGWEEEIGPEARMLANRLASAGYRLGVLTLRRWDTDSEPLCRLLLTPLSRVLVAGSCLSERLRQALNDPCGPHVFELTDRQPMTPELLAQGVDAMLSYREEPLRVGHAG